MILQSSYAISFTFVSQISQTTTWKGDFSSINISFLSLHTVIGKRNKLIFQLTINREREALKQNCKGSEILFFHRLFLSLSMKSSVRCNARYL